MDDMTVKLLMVFVAAVTSIILNRVWKIPAMEEKLDNVGKETDKNRDKIHDINNTLHYHDIRISALEKTKQENP